MKVCCTASSVIKKEKKHFLSSTCISHHRFTGAKCKQAIYNSVAASLNASGLQANSTKDFEILYKMFGARKQQNLD